MAAECSWDLPQKKSRSSAKKASDRERDKTRVNIGAAFPRWRALRADKGLQLDSELALLLLDAYEKGCLASTPPKKTRCGVLPPEASNTDEVPSCDGLGAATDTKTDHLPVAAAADETIHELPENLGAPAEEKPPSDDVLLPADPHTVLMEGDIIGSRASIVYEEKLRQLATLVHLPMKRCPHTTPTGLQCQSFAPFQCIIQQRCTAFVVEWVCPRGHVVWSWTSQPTFKFGMLAGDFMLGMNILLSANSYTKVALLFRFMNMGVVSPVTFCKIQDTYCVDAIKPLWMQRRCEVVQRIQDEDVVVSGDGGNDSAVLPSDVQKVVVVKEEQQEWSSSLDQEDPEPPHIKEEQEELWSSQEGEQLQGLEEADITKFTFTPVPVKSEDDEEKPQSSQMETEADGEDCGGPQPDRNSDTDTEDKTGDSSETETDDSEDDWTETREPQSGLNSLKDDEVPVTDERCSADEKPFSCSECGNRFGRKTNLKKHMRIHMGEKPFSCTVCAKRFMETSHLKTHMRIHTGEKPFSCPVCDKKCLQKSHLKIHMITHSGEKPFSCSICNQSFTMSGSLQSHMKIHTGEKPFSCSVCDKRFLRNTHLKLHLRTHTGEKPYSCPFCDKKFSRKRPLTHHITVHTGNKLFSCSVCKKRFAWPEQVKRHKCAGHQSSQLHQTETNENREAEPPASSSTEQMKTEADGENCGGPEPDRNSHPDSHLQPVSEDDFLESSGPDDSDGEWEETREPQSGLKSEVTVGVINSVERPFSCSECDQSFDEEPHLVAHMTLHGGEKPFSCQFCDRTFAHKRHMKLHMSFHTDEKHFSCSACDKRFTWYTQLETHQCFGESSQLRQGKSRRRARAKEPFTCADCGKKFTLKGNLKTHMRIHTGEKPFSCSVCGRSFKQNVHLTEHMTIHTGEKLFKCSVCGKGFNRKSLVKNHLCV